MPFAPSSTARPRPRPRARHAARVAPLAAVVALGAAAAAPAPGQAPNGTPVIGLITKTATNPFFVKMREGAEAAAAKGGARLLTGAGRGDADNAGQVTALENMVAAGAKVVLIAVSDAKAIVPALRRARARGVLVVALDSPPDPAAAADAVFATDNYRAGTLIGRYARAALGTRPARIAAIDLVPGHPVGAQRHNGFLAGFGLPAPGAASTTLGRPPQLVCAADGYGDQARGQTAMENCLQKNPDLTVVYAANELSAAGAARALRAAGRAAGVVLVTVDGGCQGVRDVRAGAIAATAQQYPVRMAELGVAAGLAYLRTGRKPSGTVDTGVSLIAARPAPGVESQDVNAGMASCFGRK